VEDSEVEGASDAGIYVGQSKTIVVRRNRVFGNVAGIEVENSFDADVYGNTAEGNTAGILVFDLPDLEQKNGARVRVFDNTVRGNNFRNFGKPGTTLAQLPAGTGIVVLASTDVEITGNAVEENNTMSVVVGSYLLLQRPYADTSFYPFSRRVAVRDNRITAGGGKPDTTVDFGKLLEAGRPSFAGQKVPAVVYDGIVDGRESFAPGNPMGLCLGEAERGSFARLEDIPQNRWSSAAAPYACTLPPLPPVSLSFAP
jgi:parallel beta-helix repeat protein